MHNRGKASSHRSVGHRHADHFPDLRRHSEEFDLPPGPGHRPLGFGREPPGSFHPARPRPWLAGEVSGRKVEQKLAFELVETAIERRVAIRDTVERTLLDKPGPAFPGAA